ncbi:MAG: (2Fe-2S)-binding protein [Planctomycetes bacterium]|nr:(2Fe-2S)-binding protein [Planctomycetota bacterium]
MKRLARRGEQVFVILDGQPIPAYEGESLLAALAASGAWTQVFCGMGACQGCLVWLEGDGMVLLQRPPTFLPPDQSELAKREQMALALVSGSIL